LGLRPTNGPNGELATDFAYVDNLLEGYVFTLRRGVAS